MEKLLEHFRGAHQIVITDRAAARLAETVRCMRNVEPWILLGVTGSDIASRTPRRVDVALGDLQAVVEGRRHVA